METSEEAGIKRYHIDTPQQRVEVEVSEKEKSGASNW